MVSLSPLIRLFRPSPRILLPARMTAAIEAQQAESEILIGWVQLAVVLTFAILYSLAPKTFHADIMLQPVPWALGIYAGFTLFRLLLAHRRRLPGWFLYLSIVADMALLLVTIWSFHIQYQQPPSFYLKAPTVLYVFIFIALRALRFEARFVLAAGAAAALGWLALVYYAVFSTMENPMITRNYVTYLTSNAILLGAEFDKIISILLVTAVIAAAILRARALLERAVIDGAAARDLSRFFAPEVAARITAAEHRIRAGEGEMQNAAILTVDIRGFTKLSMEAPPREVMALLSEYQSRVVPAIQRQGGSIDKFLGDGVMATFGAALPTETYAADALRAVDAVTAAVTLWNGERIAAGLAPLRIGAAVSTGPVLFGAVGDDTRLEYTVIGEAVNLAAKLENHTKREGVTALAPAAAYDLALMQGYRAPATARRLPARHVDGVEGPLDLVAIA
ncbi:adenylate/guanylate cyclase domain-containing protein [Oceanibaculum pacificum]|uniref:Adenylate cyclase n=1 Tax=Oceanibaculum pacificum TaxID=580166 RepID=A0A154WH59_9PROT|nr:adenylate/guanylate cyclase domain-containing protein [Oceanibaculum pacificum]KZD12850.1 adenylate cyclase [Oceanibaculum pacificum]